LCLISCSIFFFFLRGGRCSKLKVPIIFTKVGHFSRTAVYLTINLLSCHSAVLCFLEPKKGRYADF
jgi:hypothetical protein